MLVIISDLHLTDGTTGTTVGAAAFEDFRQHLEDFALDACERPNGEYRSIESIELVLLGDIFDIIRSTLWTDDGKEGVRPWDDPDSPAFIAKIEAITRAILAFNQETFAILKGLTADTPITVPSKRGGRQHTAVPTHIHYLVGNHDWFLHLPGDAYEAIRQPIRDALGLANPPGPFTHAPEHAPWLMEIYRAHNVFARHGDIFDPFNYIPEQGRNAATLGDALVVEVINRFPQEVKARMGHSLPAPLLEGLNELANVRPSLLVPVWVDTLLQSMDIPQAQIDEVKEIWDEMANNFLKLKFVRDQDKMFRFDVVDAMEIVLKLYDNVSLNTASKAILFIRDKFWGGESSFASYALKETAFKERWAHHIVYGHTHHYEIVPLDKVFVGYDSFNQFYFNSGTWHPVHALALAHERFVFFNVMTFMAFFKEDERKGRPFETWSGTLGVKR
jgi:UDP-2,3-diacylglucosamine pyrophosphatase LpxH